MLRLDGVSPLASYAWPLCVVSVNFLPRYLSGMFLAGGQCTRNYMLAMLAALDDAVGNVTSALKRVGLLEDSVVVFLSDNGGAVADGTPQHINGQAGAMNNFPLRGGKSAYFEVARVHAFAGVISCFGNMSALVRAFASVLMSCATGTMVSGWGAKCRRHPRTEAAAADIQWECVPRTCVHC